MFEEWEEGFGLGRIRKRDRILMTYSLEHHWLQIFPSNIFSLGAIHSRWEGVADPIIRNASPVYKLHMFIAQSD